MTCQVMETVRGGPQTGAMSTISVGPTTTSAAEAPDALRTILRLNAATSLLGGLAATAAAGPVDRLLGTGEPGWVRVMGVGLLLFAGGVASTSGATVDRLARRTPLISAADSDLGGRERGDDRRRLVLGARDGDRRRRGGGRRRLLRRPARPGPAPGLAGPGAAAVRDAGIVHEARFARRRDQILGQAGLDTG